jgi:hypothetical protein
MEDKLVYQHNPDWNDLWDSICGFRQDKTMDSRLRALLSGINSRERKERVAAPDLRRYKVKTRLET